MSEFTEDQSARLGNDQDQAASAKPSRRAIRFGLPELLLLTAVIAAWLPVIIARRNIPVLESEIQTMRLASTELVIADEQQLTARSLPSIWHNISSWKYSAPAGSDLELRLATEGINSITFPSDYQSVDLPEGEHSIHLKVTSDAKGHHSEVYVDEDLVLQQHHEREWLVSSGSTSSGNVSNQSTAYPLEEPLKLKVQRYSIEHPLQKYQSVSIPQEYDNKGNFLWISPRAIVPDPPSIFYLPQNQFSHDTVGHRTGMKVCRSSQQGLVGLICIQPSLRSTFGDRRQGYYRPLGLSVRPILESDSEPEVPEEQTNSGMPNNVGIPISLRDTIRSPKEYDGFSVKESITTNAISDDGNTMSVFAHFQPFASGAMPIVEILFDAAHPDRVGFLPHAAPGSPTIKACQFVTRFDARFFWREIELQPNSESESDVASSETAPVALTEIYPETDFSKFAEASTAENAFLPWRNIPLERLPRIKPNKGDSERFRIRLTTDVPDSSKLQFPAGLAPQWQYEGVANRQVWWLPTTSSPDETDPQIKVDVRATTAFPTTTTPLPGGPAIGNVRITVPMPATQPIWLEIVAEPPTKK